MEWVTTTTILQGLCDHGNDGAWRRLIIRFRQPIVNFAQKLGCPMSDAEDVAQETLLAFAEAYRRGQYDSSKGRLSRWLFGIAYRQAQRLRRASAQRHPKVAVGGGDMGSFPDVADEKTATTYWDREWEAAVVEQCLEQVAREVEPVSLGAFELVVRDGHTPQRVAGMLGISVKSVYNAKHRVLKRVRELRGEYEEVV